MGKEVYIVKRGDDVLCELPKSKTKVWSTSLSPIRFTKEEAAGVAKNYKGSKVVALEA